MNKQRSARKGFLIAVLVAALSAQGTHASGTSKAGTLEAREYKRWMVFCYSKVNLSEFDHLPEETRALSECLNEAFSTTETKQQYLHALGETLPPYKEGVFEAQQLLREWAMDREPQLAEEKAQRVQASRSSAQRAEMEKIARAYCQCAGRPFPALLGSVVKEATPFMKTCINGALVNDDLLKTMMLPDNREALRKCSG